MARCAKGEVEVTFNPPADTLGRRIRARPRLCRRKRARRGDGRPRKARRSNEHLRAEGARRRPLVRGWTDRGARPLRLGDQSPRVGSGLSGGAKVRPREHHGPTASRRTVAPPARYGAQDEGRSLRGGGGGTKGARETGPFLLSVDGGDLRGTEMSFDRSCRRGPAGLLLLEIKGPSRGRLHLPVTEPKLQ
jgi:hypothetical protein